MRINKVFKVLPRQLYQGFSIRMILLIINNNKWYKKQGEGAVLLQSQPASYRKSSPCVPVLKVSHNPSETLRNTLQYLGNQETSKMLTTTETIEKPISPTEKIALDNQKVCEAFIKYYEAGDRQNALEYAKVIFLKAMSL